MQPDVFVESVRALIQKMHRYGMAAHWTEYRRVKELLAEKTADDLIHKPAFIAELIESGIKELRELDPYAVKPCPFCGCEAVVENDFGRDWWVQCDEGHSEGAMHKSPKEAIAEWNRRKG